MRSKLKMRFRIALLLAFLGLGVYMLSSQVLLSMSWLSIVIIGSSLVLNLTIRCPNCGKHLTGKRTWGVPHYCSNCGTAISDEEE